MKRRIPRSFLALIVCAFWGCGREAEQKPVEQPAESDRPAESAGPTGPPAGELAPHELPRTMTEEEVKAALKKRNPDFKGEVQVGSDGRDIVAVVINDPAIEDISPLAGLPLKQIDLTGCHVGDISVLQGMPLVVLYLGETGVGDISVLKGMPLVELFLNDTKVEDLGPLQGAQNLQKLNLERARVSDLSPLRGMRRLEMLWLTGCPVSDIGPLEEVPSLVSLTAAETKVSDLSPLKGHPNLRRLHIAESEVTDLSPLEWMRLTRLIFTPRRIKTGMKFARQMETINQIDVEFPSRRGRPMSPAEFWQRFDAGEFK